MQLRNTLQDRLLTGVVVGHGVTVRPSGDALKDALHKLIAQRKEQEFPPQSVREAVRNLLRTQAFKPTGRNKPASEYLAQAAREDRFPQINNLVDINNLISLTTGLPISLLDASVIGDELLLRHGREGERYVFNAGGQDIDLNGLICACAGSSDTPLGNAIKDSMAGKIKDTTTSVVGVIYAPNTGELADVARAQVEVFADWLKSEGGASQVENLLE